MKQCGRDGRHGNSRLGSHLPILYDYSLGVFEGQRTLRARLWIFPGDPWHFAREMPESHLTLIHCLFSRLQNLLEL